MDKRQYSKYLKGKYQTYTKENHAKFAKIDAMLNFNEILEKNKEFILKGAMNLFKNYEYARQKLTKDIDYSVVNVSIDKIADNLSISEIVHGMYTFSVQKSYKALVIASNKDIDGAKIHVNVLSPMKDRFSFDVAIEEAPNIGIMDNRGIRYYSLERTLSEKFVSLYQHLEANGRQKDLVDIRDLIDFVDFPLFIEYCKQMLEVRKVEKSSIESMHSNFREYPIVKNTKTESIIDLIIRSLE